VFKRIEEGQIGHFM